MITSLARRPRLYNSLHAVRLAPALTQVTPDERQCLIEHATGKLRALEIGTFMGVSACSIARALAPGGRLTCVDPWPANGGDDPCLSIALREFGRHGVTDRIQLVRGTSDAVEDRLKDYDFIFVDGDHSEEGLAIDWRITKCHLDVGGIVCLHDTVGGAHGSARYYQTKIATDPNFLLVDQVNSLAVLRRLR
jgi:caffeoyl-CoA O-methyltransferase